MHKSAAFVLWQGEDAQQSLPCLAHLLRGLAGEVSGQFLFRGPGGASDLQPLPLSLEGLMLLVGKAEAEKARRISQFSTPATRSLRALAERDVAIDEELLLSTPERVYVYEVMLRGHDGKPRVELALCDVLTSDLKPFANLDEWEKHLVRHAALLVALAQADAYRCQGIKRRVRALEPQVNWIEE